MAAPSSKTVSSSKKANRHEEMNNSKRNEKEKEKAVNLMELKKKIIEEVVRRVGRVLTNSPMDKAEKAMRGISKSSVAQWIMKEVKPKNFNPPMLEKFQGKSYPISHLLQFKQRTSLEEIPEGLTCKLFSTTFTKQALNWFNQLPKGSIQNFEQFGRMFLE